jgi:hypothetical protein
MHDAARRERALAGLHVVHLIADDIRQRALETEEDLVHSHVMMWSRHLRAGRHAKLEHVGVAVRVAGRCIEHDFDLTDANALTVFAQLHNC